VNHSIGGACAALLVLISNFHAATLAFAQSKPESPVAEIALYQGENRLQRLIEGARKEGELTVYAVATDITLITDAFSKKYGIKVKVWRSASENVLRRVLTEALGRRFDADIMENNPPEMEAARREKMLQQVYSPHHADLMPQAIPAHREWVGDSIALFVQAYNTDKVKRDELPKTYQDLLDPKWKGRLGIDSGDHAWFATLLQELGQEKGTKLFKDIVDANGISVRSGHSLLTQMVASGEVPLGLTIYNHRPVQLKEKGAPIDWFIIPPLIAQLRTMGLLRNAPHPHAAVLFYDFMLGDAQQIFAREHYVPATRKIDTPLARLPLKFIDPALSLDLNDKWIKDYEETVTKRARH
jgi:iron(III) transport system substrate-binding protein